jgi:hypothetical protein
MIIIVTEDGIEINGVVLKDMTDLRAYIGAHVPETLSVSIGAVSPVDLSISLTPSWFETGADMHHLMTILRLHQPSALSAHLGISQPQPLLVSMYGWYYKNFNITMKAFKSTYRNIDVLFKGVFSAYGSLDVTVHGWAYKDLNIGLKTHPALSLSAYLQTYHVTDVNLIFSTVFPTVFSIEFTSLPEAGVDLQILHRASKFHTFDVSFYIWRTYYNFAVSIHGLYKVELDLLFRMGGYHPLLLPLPMTTGYRTLEVMFQPSYRIINTLLPVYTVEAKNLYVSINQGWPCGFGSTYKLLSIEFLVRYVHAFNISFKVIDGSGISSFSTFINRTDFKSYLASFGFVINMVSDTEAAPVITDSLNITYNTDFKEVYMNKVKVKFSWPRILREHGFHNFSLELFAYLEDKILDFAVNLTAIRPLPPILPSSQPLVVYGGLDEPEMPLVYQVKEVQLWNLDPPGLVRKIDVMFGGHAKEYYWVSDEQRAYRSDLYPEWSYLTKGYVPDAEYSGQMSSVILRELSDVSRYSTIDSAIRALITNFSYSSLSILKLNIIPSGGYSPLNLLMDIWGKNRIGDLQLLIQPFHISALSIEFNCQEP